VTFCFGWLSCALQLRQLDAWYRDETDRWSSEREELCRKCSQLEQRHTQWQHELRRRDVELEKLQKHLATQITATERRRRISSSSSGTAGSSSANSSSTMVLTSAGTGSRNGR
jgi:Tfp pilus assembly protein FimV